MAVSYTVESLYEGMDLDQNDHWFDMIKISITEGALNGLVFRFENMSIQWNATDKDISFDVIDCSTEQLYDLSDESKLQIFEDILIDIHGDLDDEPEFTRSEFAVEMDRLSDIAGSENAGD